MPWCPFRLSWSIIISVDDQSRSSEVTTIWQIPHIYMRLSDITSFQPLSVTSEENGHHQNMIWCDVVICSIQYEASLILSEQVGGEIETFGLWHKETKRWVHVKLFPGVWIMCGLKLSAEWKITPEFLPQGVYLQTRDQEYFPWDWCWKVWFITFARISLDVL